MKKILLFAALLLFVSAASADYYKLVEKEVCRGLIVADPETGLYEKCYIDTVKVWYSGDVPQEDVERYEAQKEVNNFYDNYVAKYGDDYLVPKYEEPIYHGPRGYGGWVDFGGYCVIVQ